MSAINRRVIFIPLQATKDRAGSPWMSPCPWCLETVSIGDHFRRRRGDASGGNVGRSLSCVPGLAVLAEVPSTLEQADTAARGLDMERYRQLKASFRQLADQARQQAIRDRDQELLNQVFVLNHFMEELEAAEREGLLHGHERERFAKESRYMQYLLTHRRSRY